jgi:hypothetical protein
VDVDFNDNLSASARDLDAATIRELLAALGAGAAVRSGKIVPGGAS